MSGVKGRSGRKPEAALRELRRRMDETISPSDWQAIWRAAVVEAKKGNLPALKLLVQYRFGSASAQPRPSAGVRGIASNPPARHVQPAALATGPHAPTDLPPVPASGAAARTCD